VLWDFIANGHRMVANQLHKKVEQFGIDFLVHTLAATALPTTAYRYSTNKS
jgi:hypothetical protein